MSFIRTRKRENPFVQLDKYFLEDGSISWAAKGILGYILSKPDSWQIRKSDLINQSTDGKASVESSMLELMAAGYLNWYQEKDMEDGKFKSWVYEVYERPEFNENAEKCKLEALKRIEERKNRNKAKNKSKNAPKVDNPPSEKPKVDNPPADNPTSDNHPFSNNDLSNIDFNNIYLEEEEEGANQVSFLTSFFLQNISERGEKTVKDKIAQWLMLVPYPVIKAELEQCVLYGAKSWMYVEKALVETRDLKIATVEDLQAKYDRYKNRVQKKPSRGSRRTIRKEHIPEYINLNGENDHAAVELTDEDKARMDRLAAIQKKYQKDVVGS